MRRPTEYDEYLKSDKWEAVRRWAIARAGGKCQLCAGRSRLEVHHNSYDRLGHEWPEDVVVLCHTCHKTHHERVGKNGRGRATLSGSPAGRVGSARLSDRPPVVTVRTEYQMACHELKEKIGTTKDPAEQKELLERLRELHEKWAKGARHGR